MCIAAEQAKVKDLLEQGLFFDVVQPPPHPEPGQGAFEGRAASEAALNWLDSFRKQGRHRALRAERQTPKRWENP